MAELNISWETVQTISTEKKAVVTGESASEATEEAPASPLRWTDKPIIIYVCDEAAGCEGFDKLEEVTLKDEKVALGMKAFRRVKMHPDDVEKDSVLQGEGREVPRMIVVEPESLKLTVLEGSKLKASKLFSTMKTVAGKVFKEKLDKLVDEHLKILTEQDQIVNAQKVINDKLGRLRGENGKDRDIAELEEEGKELNEQMADLSKKQKDLWTLTPKKA